MLQLLKKTLATAWSHPILRRNLSPSAQLRDKILEKMFNEAHQKYKDKSSGGGFFEPSEKILNELESAQMVLLEKYKARDEAEIAAFPKFTFDDPQIDPIVEEPECERECENSNECHKADGDTRNGEES